jgi:hypothetical protein
LMSYLFGLLRTIRLNKKAHPARDGLLIIQAAALFYIGHVVVAEILER